MGSMLRAGTNAMFEALLPSDKTTTNVLSYR